MNLTTEQRRLYGLMPARARCFVRLCRADDALWVSDLPRRLPEWRDTARRLEAEGFTCRLLEKERLLTVDLSGEAWARAVEPLPMGIPPLPSRDALHPLYALCRIWLLHPCAWADEPLPVLRRVVKLTAGPEEALMRAAPQLHQAAAQSLREGTPCAYSAGRWLAQWLMEKEETR